MGGTLDTYLNYLQDQGPAGKAFTMKASGAEQDDEDKPTDERTKRFERDEAKVGVVEFGTNAQLGATPEINTGSEPADGGYSDTVGRTHKKYDDDDDHEKDDEDKSKIDRSLEEIIQNYVFK